MGKKYITDSINIGNHGLDATMMASLNTVVANYSNYFLSTGGTMSGNLDVNADIQGNTFTQAASGIPRSNLGSPTVTEMALFDSEFTPKTTLANSYDDLTDLTFWVQTTSSSAWTEVTTYSDDQKRRFLRTNNSSVIIPNGAYKFRVEFVGKSYTFANALYAYWSSQSHNTQVHIWKYNVNSSSWLQHTSSSATVSSWPGHLYLPFSTIPWLESATTHTGHYKSIRVEFTPNWSTGTYSNRNINLSGMQLWGGYPSGRRTVHSYDQNGKLNLYGSLNVPGVVNIDNSGTGAPIILNSSSTDSGGNYLHAKKSDGSNQWVFGSNNASDDRITLKQYNAANIVISTASTDAIVIDQYARVGIGTTSPDVKLEVAGRIQASSEGFQIDTGGYGNIRIRPYYGAMNTSTSLYVGGVNGYSYQPVYASAFNVNSDYRLKTNVVDLEKAVERIKQLNVHRFNWKDSLDEEKVDGFLAHELAEVIPEAVTGEKDAVREDGAFNYQGVDQSKVVPLLTAALQEAILKIEQLETRIQTLENN